MSGHVRICAPLLAIEGLRVVFSNGDAVTSAVDGISFAVHKGEILAVVGESGSGKSTLAMAITRLLPVNAQISGHILFEGRNLLSLEIDDIAKLRGRRIATIFQDPAATLDPVFSIGFQFDEIIRGFAPQLSRRQRQARALELLEFVGIRQARFRLKHFPHQFSGGQLQRIVIAMALVCQPEILIADEPTTALDVTVQQGILDLLYRLNRDEKMTLILITHDMGVVADIAQRVIVMKEGRIVETAQVETLFDNPGETYSQQLLKAVPRPFPALQRQEPGKKEPVAIQGQPLSVPILQAEQLCLAYSSRFGHSRDIVHDVSFSLKRGEFVGLVGESGSGKTTIGRSLLGLITPKSGRLTLDGERLYERPRAGLLSFGKIIREKHDRYQRSRIGAVFQNPTGSLNPKLTVGQAIAEPLLAHGNLSHADRAERVENMLEQVGIPTNWAQRYPYELSGGQCQRVAIARALVLNPLLLVVDEPTSALDVSIQAGILDLLRALQKQYVFSCLFISHDLAVVRNLCQSVIVLNKGEIIEQGNVDNIFNNPQSDYTRRLIDSALLPDPRLQAERRRARLLAA